MLVTHRRPSGLILANEAMDESSVSRALKQIDPRFVLQKHSRDDAPGGFVYKVICIINDQHNPVVFTWVDEWGQPLPLSHSLVDTVQSLMLDGRNRQLGEDELNRRLLERQHREAEELRQAVRDDHRPFLERGRISVSLGTSKPRYWRRENAKPASAGGTRP